MPNQRSKNKVGLGGYLDNALFEEFMRHCRAEGMVNNKFGFAKKLIVEAIGLRQRKRKRVEHRGA
jgi:hypothetical protein